MWGAESLRTRWGCASICALAVCLPLAAWAQDTAPRPLPPLLQTDGSLNPAWRFVGFPKKQADLPPTRFEASTQDGVPAVEVSTQASYGTLANNWRGPVPARLQWRWRLDTPLSGGRPPNILTKAGDDAALKVCVMFDHPLDRVPFLERTVLRLARSVSGEALPAATLCYVWDSTYAAPLDGVNPYSRRVRFVVLQGKSAALSRWVSESRDVAQDFVRLFADELPAGAASPRDAVPPVTTVLLAADADNTASHGSGWVAGLRWESP